MDHSPEGRVEDVGIVFKATTPEELIEEVKGMLGPNATDEEKQQIATASKQRLEELMDGTLEPDYIDPHTSRAESIRAETARNYNGDDRDGED